MIKRKIEEITINNLDGMVESSAKNIARMLNNEVFNIEIEIINKNTAKLIIFVREE